MNVISELLNSQKNMYIRIFKNPIKFICPIIIGLLFEISFFIFDHYNFIFDLRCINITFIGTNAILLITICYLIIYGNVKFSIRITPIILLFCIINYILFFYVLKYYQWETRFRYLILLEIITYTIIPFLFILLFYIHNIKYIFINKIIGIIILQIIFSVLLGLIISIQYYKHYLFNYIFYYIGLIKSDILIRCVIFTIVNIYSFSIITFINLKNDYKKY